MRRRFGPRPFDRHILVEHDLNFTFERGFYGGEAHLPFALYGVAVTDGKQGSGRMDGQIDNTACAEIAVIHVSAKHVRGTAGNTAHTGRRCAGDPTPERPYRDDDSVSVIDRLLIEVDKQHAILAVREVLRQQPAVRHK